MFFLGSQVCRIICTLVLRTNYELSDDGTSVYSDCVVITTGTFLNGQINIGLDVRPAGRLNEAPSIALANTLRSLKFKMARLKTGR